MLDEFLEINGINAQILTFDEEVATSSKAHQMEGSLPIVKTILLAHAKGYALAILPGEMKVDMRKIEAILDTTKIRLATPEEVEEVTGYEVGGVPPISTYGCPSLIDEKIFTHAWVLAGGGTKFSLLKITPADIQMHAFEPRVVSLTQ